MSDTLLPCPFCGDTKPNLIEWKQKGEDGFWIYCNECEAESSWQDTKEKAIAKWNRRTEQPAQEE